MSEIEKMYENAGVSKEPAIIPSSGEVLYWKGYPPFTAEKQIELIKLLAKHYGNIHILNNAPRGFAIGIEGVSFNLKKFEEIIAMVLNAFWQDLTPEEKQQVKGILE